MKYFSIAVLFMLIFASCEKEKPQAEKDDEIINNYLTENNIDAVKHSSGLYYLIIEEGTGGHPDVNSKVYVKYKGYYTNDQVFTDTGSEIASFELLGLIEGWVIGIPLLQKGGMGTFYLPSALAYGTRGKGAIPPNTVLIFDIELVNFE